TCSTKSMNCWSCSMVGKRAAGVLRCAWAAKFTKTPLLSDRPIPVKGPGLRIDLDVRRVWRCAKCGKSIRTPAHVVSQRCGCSEPGQWMRLEPPVKREPFRPPPREPIPDEDDPAHGAPPGDSAAAAQAPVAGVSAEPREAEPKPIATEAVSQPVEPEGAI